MFAKSTRTVLSAGGDLRRLGTAFLVVVLAGCASSGGGGGGQGGSPFDSSSGADQQVRVSVDNLNFNDVTIWAFRSGQRQRVGRMGGKAQQNFRIPWDFAQEIWFEVQIVSQGSCRTNSIPADPGSRIRLLIPADINIGGRCQITRI